MSFPSPSPEAWPRFRLAVADDLEAIVRMLADDPLLEAPEHSLLAAQVEQMFTKAGAMN